MAESPSFLGLPLKVRAKIYRLAWLTRPCPINLIAEGVRKRHNASIVADAESQPYTIFCTYGYNFSPLSKLYNRCFCPRLPIQLLRVSRQVYSEAVQVLYGENVLCLSYSFLGGFTVLQNLSANAWSSMTSLSIQASGLTRLVFGDFVGHWQDFCVHLGNMVTPLQLNLSLVCTVDTLSRAKLIGKSFQNLPTLKGCSILFVGDSKDRDTLAELGHLAKELSLKSSGKLPSLGNIGATSKLDALPVEVKRLILEHSDLVRDEDVYQCGHNGVCVQNGKFQSNRLCCETCIDSLIDCDCPFIKSGYSTTCTCLRIPLALFLINKTFNELASDIFYSLNQFVFLGNPESTLTFLRSRQASNVEKIKSIVLAPDSNLAWQWSDRSVGKHDFQECVEFIKKNFNLSQLSLTLDIRVDQEKESYLDSAARIILVQDKYPKVVGVCTKLQGLKKFYVFLSFEHEAEATLEKMVMGEAYDRENDGKPQPDDRMPRTSYVLSII